MAAVTDHARPPTASPSLVPPALAPVAVPARAQSRAPTAARLRKELRILEAAEVHFAQFGFEGASLALIAQDAGLSRHNLLYYFASKEALYLHVLNDILTQWLAGMSDLLRGDDPAQALRTYIRAKLQSSQQRPNASKVFTREVMAGAPRFAAAIATRVAPALAADVQAFERWVAQGKIARVDFVHLMFILWSVTQAYADQQAQFALLLGVPALQPMDFDAAEAVIYQLVVQGLQTTANAAPTAAAHTL